MTLPLLTTRYLACRVVVDDRGTALPSKQTFFECGIKPDVIFLRSDGWTLGAPKELERVAYDQWPNDWTHFARRPFKRWIPIAKYGGAR